MKKLCIFDFDGTLFDTIGYVVTKFNGILKKLGYDTLTLEEYKHSLGGNINEIIAKLIGEDATDDEKKILLREYEKSIRESDDDPSEAFPEMIELLEKLERNNVLLAINSNRKTVSINRFLEKYASHIEFVDIQGHVSDNPSKPDPYGVNMILEKADVKKEDAVYVGDSKTDVQTAMNAGIDCILVDWGYGVDNVYSDEYVLKVVSRADEIFDLVLTL